MQLIKPESHDHWLQLKAEDISSTESSALFGINPWITKFELWHRKKNKEIVTIEETQRMKWGTRLESAIAKGIAEDHGWSVEPFKDYARIEGERIGASFDFKILPNGPSDLPGLLEIKNVDGLQFKEKWVIEDGEVVEAPPHIELQAQHQLMVTGFDKLYIGALVGGNTVAVIPRKPQEAIISQLKTKIKEFWDSIDANEPPAPDFIRDADFLADLYASAEPGKILDANDNEQIRTLVMKYKQFADYEKDIGKKKQAAKAELLTLIGEAEKVTAADFTISAGVVGPTQVAYERKGYRNFRVYVKK